MTRDVNDAHIVFEDAAGDASGGLTNDAFFEGRLFTVETAPGQWGVVDGRGAAVSLDATNEARGDGSELVTYDSNADPDIIHPVSQHDPNSITRLVYEGLGSGEDNVGGGAIHEMGTGRLYPYEMPVRQNNNLEPDSIQDSSLPGSLYTTYIPGDGPNSGPAAGSVVGLSSFFADTAFNAIRGEGTSIVILDSGFNTNDVVFGSRVVYSYDFAGNSFGAGADANVSNTGPRGSHGNEVASVAAGSTFSFSGVAPGANLILFKVFYDGGLTTVPTAVDAALNWIASNATTYNIVGVNFSFGSGNTNSVATSSPYAVGINANANNQIAFVASSGNEYANVAGTSNLSALQRVWGVGSISATSFGKLGDDIAPTNTTLSPDEFIAYAQRSPTLTDLVAPGFNVEASGLLSRLQWLRAPWH
jgi:hypothetical protein